MKLEFTLDNVLLFQEAFREFPKKDARKIINQSIRKALVPLQKELKRTSPRRTGALRKDVKIRASKYKKYKGMINLWVIQGSKYPGQFPGGFLEYGTKRIRARGYVAAAQASKRIEMTTILSKLVRDRIIQGTYDKFGGM